MKKILYPIALIIFMLLNNPLKSQSDTITNIKALPLKQVITYYQNGNIHKIENFVSDSRDNKNNNLYLYGIYKEYHSNGIIKALGQYDCSLWNSQKNKEKIVYDESLLSFKIGYWHEYDSLGIWQKTTMYNKNFEHGYRYPRKRDTILIKSDSIKIKIKPYEQINSYLIRRSRKNKYLSLEFPIYSYYSNWFLCDAPAINYIGDSDSDSVFHFYGICDKVITRFSYNLNIPKIMKNSFDFSTLKNGIYYMHYQQNHTPPIHYEVQIILEDL